jgi:hypothetical protein
MTPEALNMMKEEHIKVNILTLLQVYSWQIKLITIMVATKYLGW